MISRACGNPAGYHSNIPVTEGVYSSDQFCFFYMGLEVRKPDLEGL